jgi:hypothetical protein
MIISAPLMLSLLTADMACRRFSPPSAMPPAADTPPLSPAPDEPCQMAIFAAPAFQLSYATISLFRFSPLCRFAFAAFALPAICRICFRHLLALSIFAELATRLVFSMMAACAVLYFADFRICRRHYAITPAIDDAFRFRHYCRRRFIAA